eukprot:gnl/MRDRNA2_/MRDRNA2_35154_c0_seq1.p1 gnl/MRDRNA2_/MRDRNA2_35154_c0~~gnl/MRDRNA2_/MRDRNA2_35154_c0_seq1.p1  ORF type:complete len:267 (+),score=39.42 gnl/MRDRNA2_/MRDRNA2_35154_c0_seq1:60-860(+)
MGQTPTRNRDGCPRQGMYTCCQQERLGDLDSHRSVEFPVGPSSVATTPRAEDSPLSSTFGTARLGEAVKALQIAQLEEQHARSLSSSAAAKTDPDLKVNTTNTDENQKGTMEDTGKEEVTASQESRVAPLPETHSSVTESIKIDTPDSLRRKRNVAYFFHFHDDRRNLQPWGALSFRNTEDGERNVRAHLVDCHTDRNHLRSRVAGHVYNQENQDKLPLALRAAWAVPLVLVVNGCSTMTAWPASNCCCSMTKETPARVRYRNQSL